MPDDKQTKPGEKNNAIKANKVEPAIETKNSKQVDNNASKPVAAESKKTKKPKKKRSPFFSAIVVAIINILGLLAVVFVMTLLNTKSIELKSLRNATIGAMKRSEANVGDLQIESNITKYEDLKSLFPDEEGVVEFVKEVEKLKVEGVVSDFSFVNQEVVTDRTKSMGFPFILEFTGGWEEIDRDLKKIQNLPFIVRAVTVSIEPALDESNNVVLKYGGFLYVGETFNQYR